MYLTSALICLANTDRCSSHWSLYMEKIGLVQKESINRLAPDLESPTLTFTLIL